jgi:hypothetical protein
MSRSLFLKFGGTWSIQQRNHSVNFTIETVYSAFRGRCYAIKFKEMMDENLDFLDIGLKTGQNLHLYTLEPGLEKLLTFEFWIKKPRKLELKKEYTFADLHVTKEIIMQESNDCDLRNSYEYVGKSYFEDPIYYLAYSKPYNYQSF